MTIRVRVRNVIIKLDSWNVGMTEVISGHTVLLCPSRTSEGRWQNLGRRPGLRGAEYGLISSLVPEIFYRRETPLHQLMNVI